MARRSIPWDQIKADYTLGIVNERGERVYPTYRDLMRKYKVSMSTLRRHIRDEGWNEIRERNRNEIETKSLQKTVEKISNAQAELTEMTWAGARQLIEEALAGVDRYRAQVERIFADESLDESERTKLLKDASLVLKNYAQAFGEAVAKARLALGEPTEITEEPLTLERMIRETIAWAKEHGLEQYIDVTPLDFKKEDKK